ncbi:tellurite resistance TerB family protein [Enterovirga rhinocerotis]|uniref:Uncharacterized membrane protein YebE (DUF533 family) n=1 Tax=Enterovirga rhinocerotis TaxID=1339210 RepID=A0A4V3DXA6_9HYPH|nr:tellurite resistance TerB family protein [Enterovirga rhinocerotis]TDR87969.1 uncharacterized membrane protein YebE (DUF533 family) [Enterovirga rhinocerotis]
MNITDLLGTLIANQVGKAGTRGGAQGGTSGGVLGDLTRVLGSRAGTAIAGTLAGMVFGSKKGRKAGGSLAKLGGLAVVGSLAWQAYQDWQAKQGQAAQPAGGSQPRPATANGPFGAPATEEPPAGSPLAPTSSDAEEELSRVLIRAMIAAAKADGGIDATEQAALATELQKMQLTQEDGAFVLAELSAPLDVARVAEGARGPEIAAAIYAASLLAITVDTAAERDYLAALAARLKLDPALVASLHAKVDAEAPIAGA